MTATLLNFHHNQHFCFCSYWQLKILTRNISRFYIFLCIVLFSFSFHFRSHISYFIIISLFFDFIPTSIGRLFFLLFFLSFVDNCGIIDIFFYLCTLFLLTYSSFASLHLFLMFLFNALDFVTFLGIFSVTSSYCWEFHLSSTSFFSYLAFLVVISFSDIIRDSLNVFHIASFSQMISF